MASRSELPNTVASDRVEKAKINGMRRPKKQEEQHTVWSSMLEVEPYEADAGPKNPGAVAMGIDLPRRLSESTAHSSEELGAVLGILSSGAMYVGAGISRTGERRFSRAVQQRECSHTQQYYHGAISVLCY